MVTLFPYLLSAFQRESPSLFMVTESKLAIFFFVKDVANANYLAGLNGKTGVYNLGSGGSITINKLAEIMQNIAGRDVGVQYLPKRPADVLHCKANAQKAHDRLGFDASVSLEDGLAQYWQWFMNDKV